MHTDHIAQSPRFAQKPPQPAKVPLDRQASSFSRSIAPSPELSPKPGTYGCRHIATPQSVDTTTTASPRVDHHQKHRRSNSGFCYATLCDENKALRERNDELEKEMADAKTAIWVLQQRLDDIQSRYRTVCKEKRILVEENTKMRGQLNGGGGDDEVGSILLES